MSKKQRKTLWRIILSAFLLIIAVLADKILIKDFSVWLTLAVYLVPYLIIGYDVLIKAGKNIINGQMFDESFLMTIATVGAIFLGFFPEAEPQYPEAVFVMLFYQTGELFQSIAVGKSRKSIAALMNIRPDVAYVERNGELIEVDPEEITVGEIITVRPGDRVPLDGIVLSGSSALDTAALTGESVPRSINVGDTIISGCINLSGALTVKVTKVFGESTVSRILELVENSSNNKSKSENFITKFARVYTPLVVLAAVILAFVPPIFAVGSYLASLPSWLVRALSFLVISCPCALVISVPLSFFGGIGGASKQGILIKGSNYLEALSELYTITLDKTGTLTEGTFTVTEIHSDALPESRLLQLAALAEVYSVHPIALALRKAAGELPESEISDTKELSGQGVIATVDGKVIAAGNERLMRSCSLVPTEFNGIGTVVHVAIDGKYEGFIVISDQIKKTTANALQQLKSVGVKQTVMLTGDSEKTAEAISNALKIDGYRAELLPEDKVTAIKELKLAVPDGKKLAFIGDGINDAPVLVSADIGIAMGALGSDAAIEAADVVLMDDNLEKVATAVKIARRTLKIVRQNIIFALGIKAIVLLLGIFGYAPMWLAIFADVGVAVIAILNAIRTLN